MMRAAVSPRGRRSDQGAKTGVIVPWLLPAVLVAPETPGRAETLAMPGTSRAMAAARSTTSVVRASEAPPGSSIEMVA